jgi:hypothetical protein
MNEIIIIKHFAGFLDHTYTDHGNPYSNIYKPQQLKITTVLKNSKLATISKRKILRSSQVSGKLLDNCVVAANTECFFVCGTACYGTI